MYLNVAVHLQDDPDACGRACAEMTLLFVTGNLHQQRAMIPIVEEPGWATSPDQLCHMINSRLAPNSRPYKVFADRDRSDALQRVRSALAAGFPAISLCEVRGFGATGTEHWIVVHGLTKGQPAVAHIRNPLPDREDAIGPPLPDHTMSDICPKKDLANSGKPHGEVASVWSRACMSPATGLAADDRYNGRYVVLVPEAPAPAGPEDEHERFLESRTSVSGPSAVVAWQRLQESGLLTENTWRVLAEGQPLTDQAQLVTLQPLDASDRPLTLVRLQNSAGVTVLVTLSEAGEFVGALLEPGEQLLTTQFEISLDRMAIERDAAVRPVWVYSRTTFFSPFVYLLEVSVGGQKYFVRPYDGKRFLDAVM